MEPNKKNKEAIPGIANPNRLLLDISKANIDRLKSLAHSKAFEALIFENKAKSTTSFAQESNSFVRIHSSALPSKLTERFSLGSILEISNLDISLHDLPNTAESRSNWRLNMSLQINGETFSLTEESTDPKETIVKYKDASGNKKSTSTGTHTAAEMTVGILASVIAKGPAEPISLDSLLASTKRDNSDAFDPDTISRSIMLLGSAITGISEKSTIAVIPIKDEERAIAIELLDREHPKSSATNINVYMSWDVTGEETELLGYTRDVSGAFPSSIAGGHTHKPRMDKDEVLLTLPISYIGEDIGSNPPAEYVNSPSSLTAINTVVATILTAMAEYGHLDEIKEEPTDPDDLDAYLY